MSNNVYSFHTRKQRELNPVNVQAANKAPIHESSVTPAQTKMIVLQSYDYFTELKNTNSKVKYLSETQDKISKEIVDTVGLLQNSASKDNSSQLTAKLEHMNQLHNQLKEEYTEILKTELKVLYENWPPLFDKFIEGVDRETLEHVLTVFDEQTRGKYSADMAVSQGIDFMTQKYNLPKDFFNKNAIKDFNQNLLSKPE